MLEIVELIKELDAYLRGMPVNFSRLRGICRDFNCRCVKENIFNTNGTDEQLWESVTTYFPKLPKA